MIEVVRLLRHNVARRKVVKSKVYRHFFERDAFTVFASCRKMFVRVSSLCFKVVL
jgi:hypothetical protein